MLNVETDTFLAAIVLVKFVYAETRLDKVLLKKTIKGTGDTH